MAKWSTFQQVFLTFRPHRLTFHMCDVLGVDSKAQHSHRQLICEWNVEYVVEPQEENCFYTATSCCSQAVAVIMFASFMLFFSFCWFIFVCVWMVMKGLKVSLYTCECVTHTPQVLHWNVNVKPVNQAVLHAQERVWFSVQIKSLSVCQIFKTLMEKNNGAMKWEQFSQLFLSTFL